MANPEAKVDDVLKAVSKVTALHDGTIPKGPADGDIQKLVKSRIVGLLSLNELSDLQATILKSLLEYEIKLKIMEE